VSAGGDPGAAAAPVEGAGGRASRGGLLGGLVNRPRPTLGAKTVLVFAAPAAAGVLDNREWALDALMAFVCFCLAAAGTYYINDARDVAADRRHPEKRRRPVASGVVPVPVA